MMIWIDMDMDNHFAVTNILEYIIHTKFMCAKNVEIW